MYYYSVRASLGLLLTASVTPCLIQGPLVLSAGERRIINGPGSHSLATANGLPPESLERYRGRHIRDEWMDTHTLTSRYLNPTVGQMFPGGNDKLSAVTASRLQLFCPISWADGGNRKEDKNCPPREPKNEVSVTSFILRG